MLKTMLSASMILLLLAGLVRAASLRANAQHIKSPFTVADDIGLALFRASDRVVRFSPDGMYFAVFSERGRLDINRVDDSLRFYHTQDIKGFLERSNEAQPPHPVLIVTRPTSIVSDAPPSHASIADWRWLNNSSGVAYLWQEGNGHNRLVVVDLHKKVAEALTPATESVESFDILDRQHYVYTVHGAAPIERGNRISIVGTGHNLGELLFPYKPIYAMLKKKMYTNLWAVINGKRFEVKEKSGMPLGIALGVFDREELVLAPDGRYVIASTAVSKVPKSWKMLYPPPFSSDTYDSISNGDIVHQFVLINLQTGSIRSLTDAPLAEDAGTWESHSFAAPSWSNDGHAILLPGTFLKSNSHLPSRPCVAVVDLSSRTRTCVMKLTSMFSEPGGVEPGPPIANVHFVNGDRKRVAVVYEYESGDITEYRRAGDIWQVALRLKDTPKVTHSGLEVTIKQGFNQPPLLVATEDGKTKVIWDPNPQLKNIAMGEVRIYRWKDKEGREWKGGLYKPVNYKRGLRYPLVLQTHGFVESEFRPSGIYPSGFAARELAAAGILVLQSPDVENCPFETPQEHACAISGYEAGVHQLIAEGLADPEKIGIIGFSHSGEYVLDELTAGSLHIKAALIEDADLINYFRYLTEVDEGSLLTQEYAETVGAQPFGEGLQLWLKRTPTFNLEKITAPLRIVVHGPDTFLLPDWEAYAGLRYLHKPVDLILLNPDNVKGISVSEHVLWTPALRMISQGGSVDWFRFWLQGYEDPDPAKAAQYRRWEELRKLQQADEAKTAATTNQ